jgi:hypothetical protein
VKTQVQTQFSRMLSIFTAASMLVTLLSLFPTRAVSATGVVGTITRPGFLPTALALDASRNRLFVFDQSTHKVFVYNATTFQELGSVATSLSASYSMAVDESQGKLYVGFSDPGVSVTEGIAVIDIPTITLLKYLPSGGYTNLINDEQLDLIYASSNGSVNQIDVATDEQTAIAGIWGNLYTSMAVNPVTHELFVANWSQNNNDFFVVNPSTLALTTIPNMNGFGVAVNWTENKAYVTYCQSAGYEAVCIYDRDTGSVTRFRTDNDTSEPLVFNPLVNRMYSNTEVNRVATILNGTDDSYTNITMTGGLSTVGVRYSTDNVYYVNQAGTYVMKGSTGRIVADFPVGATCSVCGGDIVINQTSGLVYIINDDSAAMVTIIQDGEFSLACTVTPLAGAGSYPGSLSATDCHSPLRNETSYWDPFYADRYSFSGTAGQQVSLTLDGGTAYEYLYLIGPSGNVLAEASGDVFGPAKVPSSSTYTLPVSGSYIIEATSLYSSTLWSYTLTLNISTPPGAFNKSSPGNGATGQSTSPTLTWVSSSGATSYEYCYDTTNDNACSNWTSNGTSTSKALSGLSNGTTYYWHVRAINTSGTTYSNGSTTAFWSFSTATNPPGAFNKSTPANGATGQSTGPTLSWAVSTGATSYEYCYDTTNDNACSTWMTNGSSTSITLNGLSQGTAYYWHVRAVNAGGTTYSNGSATAFWSFTTATNPPGAFNKSSPANGATGQSTSLTLSWASSSGGTSYEYCYDATNDSACSTWTSNGASTSKALTGLSAGTTYYWHVRAVNARGTTYSNASATAFWSFTTAITPPGAFNKSSPANAAIGQPTSPTLSWGSSTGATSYEYCYDTTNDNACSNWTSNGTSTSKALSGLSVGTTYYWQVRALNAGGTTYSNGSATAVWSFTTGTTVSENYWSMYGHDSAHTSWSPVNGPNTADLAWVYPDEIVGDVVVGPDGTIYGSSYNPSILRAIKPDGTLKWQWPAGFAETINHLAVVDNTLYAVVSITESTLYAFNATTGSVVWTYPFHFDSYSNPTIGADGTIYIASQLGDYHPGGDHDGGYLYAIHPNGTLKWIWNSGTPNCGIETSAAIGPTGDIYIQHNCLGLVALDSNGLLKWSRGGGQLGQPFNSPSIGPDGTIYIGSSDYTFRALNPNGSEKWQVAVDNWMYDSSSAISADGSTIYRGDNAGVIYAFDSRGFVKWKFDSGWGIMRPPTLSANGIVYFTQSLDSSAATNDKAYLYALRASDGALVWKYELGESGGTPVLGPDGTLYVTREQPSGDWFVDNLYAFRCADGTCAIPDNTDVLIGSTDPTSYLIPIHASLRKSYANINSGPVKITSSDGTLRIASQRVIYGGVSYSEMMGLPAKQLTKEYLFPYYNNVAMDSQLRVSNVGGADTTIKVYLGTTQIDSYTLAAGGASRKNYTGRNSGPLRVVSSNSNILATVRVLYGGSSYSELMGLPVEQLAKEYLFPYYNNVAMDSQLRVSNVGGADTTITVYLGTTQIDSYTLKAGGATRKNYTGRNSGPLRVTSSASNILTTIRVLYGGGSYSELMGFPIGLLEQEYWYPVYDNVAVDSQLRVSNVGTGVTTITIYASGTQIDSYTLNAGAATRKNYPRNSGPLHVVSSTQPILTTVRTLYAGSSYYEMTGLPDSQLSTQYFFPWYNNKAMESELRIAVP